MISTEPWVSLMMGLQVTAVWEVCPKIAARPTQRIVEKHAYMASAHVQEHELFPGIVRNSVILLEYFRTERYSRLTREFQMAAVTE